MSGADGAGSMGERGAPRRAARRIGLFGLLGSGNLGNDASLEAVVAFLRARFPDAELVAMCAGPERVSAAHGIPAVPLHSYDYAGPPRRLDPLRKLWAKLRDTVRTAVFVRRCDVVVVPGMGVLETTLPLRPWGWPWTLFVLAASGRLVGTTVALVGVGANEIRAPLTRRLIVAAARLTTRRSFRDQLSKDALARMGVDTSGDEVHPDLVFTLPEPADGAVVPRSVAVGVIDYHGGDDDRAHAEEIHAAYQAAITAFVGSLLDEGRQVRLVTGDDVDRTVVATVVAAVTRSRPGLARDRLLAEPVSSYAELMSRLQPAEVVVASRYHNVIAALKLGKPTVALGYGAKNDVLMAAVGLGGFTQSLRALDLDRLQEQLRAAEAERDRLVDEITRATKEFRAQLDGTFDRLAAALTGPAG